MSRQHFTFIAALAALTVVSCSDTTSPELDTEFEATLTGTAERPNPVSSTATGTATVTINDAAETIAFSVTVNGITTIIASHIHTGRADVAGPIVVNLLTTTPPAGAFSGVLASGNITQASIATSVPVTFASLASLIRNGDAYVNVHTQANQGGEIRGQLLPK